MAGDTPIRGGGIVAVVSPGGVAGTVPEDKLEDALRMGYRLEQAEEHTERRRETEYGDRPVTAAALGAASSLTFGGSDVIASALAGAGGRAENAVQEISARNQGARLVGELGGLVTGVGAAGLVGGAGRATAKAAGGGLRGAVAGGAAEGGLLGSGETVSHVGLSKDPLTAEAVAGDLTRNVLLGGALGGGGGAVGELVSRAAGKAKQGLTRLSDDLAARATSPERKAMLEEIRATELSRLEAAAVPERKDVFAALQTLRGDQKPLRQALGARLSSAPEQVRADLLSAERSLAGLAGNARKLEAQPELALDAVANYRRHLGDALGVDPPELGKTMLDRVGKLEQRLEVLRAGPSSPQLADLDAQLAAAAKPAKKSLVGDVAKAGLVAGAVAAADVVDLPGAGMLAFLLAGKLGGRIGEAVGSKLGVRAAEVGTRVARAAASVAGVVERGAVPALARAATLGAESFDRVRDAALEAAADPEGTRARIHDQLDGVRLHDPQLADQLAEVQIRGALHLAAVAPKAPGAPTLIDQSAPVSRMERDRFLRRAEVVMDPTALLDRLEDGTLTPADVETGDAVYTEIMTALRGRLIESMRGKPVSNAKRLALSILLGAPATPSLRPEMIAANQARINAEIQNAARRPTTASPAQPEEPLRSQRLAGGR